MILKMVAEGAKRRKSQMYLIDGAINYVRIYGRRAMTPNRLKQRCWLLNVIFREI